ncbi:hypothetical protein FW774_01550 (plasmid) [Pedobacter sp. BS3]|uniref:hypothetical protein n=1 Tax=Pedobacter sp. BS3 TaxID=2567937 RepID=UPI0011EE56DF|nr:hypothetical protein [Pedobacter sp. BS3]TZF85783.1 hypothetical protein FW774_01550 [Pedobacter sp. BS3]
MNKHIHNLTRHFLGFLLFYSVLIIQAKAQTLRVSTSTQDSITRVDSLWFTPQEYVDYVFGNLDMQDVTTHFLLERSLSAFDPEAYDGKNSNDSTIRTTAQGMQVYSAFYYSALDTSASYAPAHPSQVSEWAGDFNRQGYVPILLLNHAYHSIKQDALMQGLFTTNIDSTTLYDNPTRTSSPYRQNRLFVAVPYILNKAYARLCASLNFRPDMAVE